MTTLIDADNINHEPTSVTTNYTTSGDEILEVDTSGGAVTVTLASADTTDGQHIRVIDTGLSASTNAITVDTEGSETINPGSNSSITLNVDGTWVDLWSDGSNWFADRAPERQSLRLIGALTWADTNRQTLSGNLTLSDSDARIQSIDPGGSGRDVTLPAESDGDWWVIGNRADAAEDLTVKDDGGGTIATVNQDDVGYFVSDGTGWLGFAAAGGVT